MFHHIIKLVEEEINKDIQSKRESSNEDDKKSEEEERREKERVSFKAPNTHVIPVMNLFSKR